MRQSGRLPFSVLMTNYPYGHDPDDTLDEAYQRWLDNNGFPAMRQLLADQGCEDVAVLRSVPSPQNPYALPARTAEVKLRDGRGLRRDR